MPFLPLQVTYLTYVACTQSSNNPQHREHCPRRYHNPGPSSIISSTPTLRASHYHSSCVCLLQITPLKAGYVVRVCGRRALLDRRQKKTKTLYVLAHNVRIMVGLGQAGFSFVLVLGF